MVVALLVRGLARGSFVSFGVKDLTVLRGFGLCCWEAMGEGPLQVTVYLVVLSIATSQRQGSSSFEEQVDGMDIRLGLTG